MRKYGKPELPAETENTPAAPVAGDNTNRTPVVSVKTEDKSGGRPKLPVEEISTPPTTKPSQQLPNTAVTKNPTEQSQTVGKQFPQSTIKRMQETMINLAKEMADHPLHRTPDRQVGENDTVIGTQSFMNFIISNIANKATTRGKQFVNADIPMPTRVQTAKDNDHFLGVLNSITQIGSSGSDQTPDGIWGPRTNLQLHNLYSLAYALIQVQKEILGKSSEYYTDADLVQLHSQIPTSEKDIDTAEKVKRATIITKNLEKFRAVYENFRDKVLATYGQQISQQKPLFTLESKRPDPVSKPWTDRDTDLLHTYYNVKVPVKINYKDTTLTPLHLNSLQDFKQYLLSNEDLNLDQATLQQIKVGDPNTVNKLVHDVLESLRSKS